MSISLVSFIFKACQFITGAWCALGMVQSLNAPSFGELRLPQFVAALWAGANSSTRTPPGCPRFTCEYSFICCLQQCHFFCCAWLNYMQSIVRPRVDHKGSRASIFV